MHEKQLALLESALDTIAAECLRSAVATFSAAHLKAVLVEAFLRQGAVVVERGATSGEGKLLRMVDEVVKVERRDLRDRSAPRRGRPPRLADLRLLEPIALNIDLYARSLLASPDREGSRALVARFDALAAGSSDVLILACDRRAYDGLRIERSSESEQPVVLSRLCAALLPPSTELGEERTRSAPRLNGRGYGTLSMISPMVFGSQRVIAAVWPAQRAVAAEAGVAQLDAFAAG